MHLIFISSPRSQVSQLFQVEILQFIELRIDRNSPIILEKPPVCAFKPRLTKKVKLIMENVSQGLSLHGLWPFTDSLLNLK